ncbi:mitochondrial fission regulator 2 [Syngnathoides biaculeatus]|uniref:mitochondrial fission regulator 2 n=1 Tax=Syngnathoides biaculeatus TaxID=300417 RepID=UPI002ADE83FA|nr:mitochondrial fission regulator 2 [Syngnathoides biaculeatus]
MSLLEDALDVLRMLLDYFGVPPEVLIPVWDSPLCGQYRSIVRMIGSNIPLTPTPRVHFQLPLTSRPHGYTDVATETPTVPSFADVLWVVEDDGDGFAKNRDYRPLKKSPRRQVAGVGCVGQKTHPEALEKISALESELFKLRAQIAILVTATQATDLPGSQNMMSPVPGPALTSTPRPPPPPPLPPPPCPSSSSVGELIRRRKCHGKDSGTKQLNAVQRMPSMLDVLKDLKQVKLRSVERSPGGTPVSRSHSKGGPAVSNDPAILIAEALKRKFAQQRHNDSSDKENSLDSSPIGSPDSPKMFHHARRSKGLLHL